MAIGKNSIARAAKSACVRPAASAAPGSLLSPADASATDASPSVTASAEPLSTAASSERKPNVSSARTGVPERASEAATASASRHGTPTHGTHDAWVPVSMPPERLQYLPDDSHAAAAPSAALVQSVRSVGVLEPLLAAILPDETVLLLSGHQRLAAARLCALKEVPVLLRPVADLATAGLLAAQLAPFATGIALREEKFTMVSALRSDLPDYLL